MRAAGGEQRLTLVWFKIRVWYSLWPKGHMGGRVSLAGRQVVFKNT